MRRSAIALTAMLVLAIAAVAYAQQQNTYTVSGGTTPSRAGSKAKPVAVSVKFGYKVGESSGNRPSPVKKYSILFTGLQTNTRLFPSCTAAKIEADGPDSCPSGSAVGSGFIQNETGAANNPADKSVKCNAALTVFNGGNDRATIYVAGDPEQSDERRRCAITLNAPIPAKFVKKNGGSALEFTVPSSLLHPLPTLDNAVVNVTSTIKNVKRKGRGFFESVGGCKGGKRKIEVTFTPERGSTKKASTMANCSR